MLIKERFVPIQIEENLCLKCERCTQICKNNARTQYMKKNKNIENKE